MRWNLGGTAHAPVLARYSSSGCVHDRFDHRGVCEAPPDCRTEGCDDAGRYCSYCGGSWACIPRGPLC